MGTKDTRSIFFSLTFKTSGLTLLLPHLCSSLSARCLPNPTNGLHLFMPGLFSNLSSRNGLSASLPLHRARTLDPDTPLPPSRPGHGPPFTPLQSTAPFSRECSLIPALPPPGHICTPSGPTLGPSALRGHTAVGRTYSAHSGSPERYSKVSTPCGVGILIFPLCHQPLASVTLVPGLGPAALS